MEVAEGYRGRVFRALCRTGRASSRRGRQARGRPGTGGYTLVPRSSARERRIWEGTQPKNRKGEYSYGAKFFPYPTLKTGASIRNYNGSWGPFTLLQEKKVKNTVVNKVCTLPSEGGNVLLITCEMGKMGTILPKPRPRPRNYREYQKPDVCPYPRSGRKGDLPTPGGKVTNSSIICCLISQINHAYKKGSQ